MAARKFGNHAGLPLQFITILRTISFVTEEYLTSPFYIFEDYKAKIAPLSLGLLICRARHAISKPLTFNEKIFNIQL